MPQLDWDRLDEMAPLTAYRESQEEDGCLEDSLVVGRVHTGQKRRS